MRSQCGTLGFSGGKGLLVLFALTILLPGVLLSAFGIRGLLHERQLAEQQVRERLDQKAVEIRRNLEFELRRWQQLLDVPATATSQDPPVPDGVREELNRHHGAVLVHRDHGRESAFPARRLLYRRESGPDLPVMSIPHDIAAAESLEIRQRDFSRAIPAYEALLSSASAAARPIVIHRLARALRKAGRHEESLRRYRELESYAGTRIGLVPADLVARFESCSILGETHSKDGPGASLGLYRDLVEGRWALEKPRYLYYAESARRWAEQAPELAAKVRELRALETEKASITEASFQLLDEPRRALLGENGVFLAFWRERDDARTVLVLSPGYCRTQLRPQILGNSSIAPLTLSVVAPGGHLFAGEPLPTSAGLSSTQTAADGVLSWQISVWPQDLKALYRGVSWRQYLYLGMISLVVAMLGFGGYFMMRAVRREMEVTRLKSDFVSAVSHEFRSPLTGIRQIATMLEQGRVRTDEKRQQYYTLMRRESDRLARLVENLLDFSRMEEGRREYRKEPIDVSSWLSSLAEEFRGNLSGQEATLETAIPENLPMLLGDREALSTAVLNLLDNAVKYSLPPVTVWLEAEAVGADTSIRVRDEGVGIGEEDRARIFEKFYRAASETTGTVKGAGLGLSLAHHIVTAHGGTIQVDSRPGAGSTFTIRLRAAT